MSCIKSFCSVMLFALTVTASPSRANLVSYSYGGSITSWAANPMGIADTAQVVLNLSYDDSWITPYYYNGQIWNVINIIDYYGQGARADFHIGNYGYFEIYSESPVTSTQAGGWYNSIPYLAFDTGGQLTGIVSQWIDNQYNNGNPVWDMDIGLTDAAFSIYFYDYASGTQGYIGGTLDLAPVPLPAPLPLLASGLLCMAGIAKQKFRATETGETSPIGRASNNG